MKRIQPTAFSRSYAAALALLCVWVLAAPAAAHAAAYRYGTLDGPLADHLLAVLQPTKWQGETDGLVILAGKNARKIDGKRLQDLLAVRAAGQPIVLTNATKEHVKALMDKLGRPVPVEPRPPYDHFDYYAYAGTASGPRTFTMMPVFPLSSQPLSQLATEADIEKLQRAQQLLTWIEQNVRPSAQTESQPSGAQGTGGTILDIATQASSFSHIQSYPVVYYWATCGTEVQSCTNTYQLDLESWPVYSANAAAGAGNPTTDFFVMQLSANLNTSGCWNVYQNYNNGGLSHQDRIAAFWARQYQFTANVEPNLAACAPCTGSSCPSSCNWAFSDLSVEAGYNPLASDPNISVQEGTSWSVGGSGSAGATNSVGFNVGASFSQSTTYQYQALETIPSVAADPNNPGQAQWTYDAWNFVRANIEPGDKACGGSGLKDLANDLGADVITDGTFSPTMTYVWEVSKNMRQTYAGGTLPVNFDLGVLLGWTFYPNGVTNCQADDSVSQTEFSLDNSPDGWALSGEETSGLVYDVSCAAVTEYGTIPLGPAESDKQNNAIGNPGAPYKVTMAVNVPFAAVLEPTLGAVSPNWGAQGQKNLSVILTGENFQPETTCGFGPGITVLNGCVYGSSTQMTANLIIGAGATIGPRTVTVTNPGGQSASLVNGFHVSGPPPTVSSLSVTSGSQGQSLSGIQITGTNFQTGATCDFGAGITVTSCTVNSTTQLTADITIASTAVPGPRTITVTNPDVGSGSLTNGFTVVGPPPTINSITPNFGYRGESLAVTITGLNFQSGILCSFGVDITVNSCVFHSPDQLTANIVISATAATGLREVTVTNPDGGSVTRTDRFTVFAAPQPIITSVTPVLVLRGESPTVVIKGKNFQSGATCSFGAVITVNSCQFNDSTQMTAQITVPSTAAPGVYPVKVQNPDGQTGISEIVVPEPLPTPPPQVNALSPTSGQQGQSLPVTISGKNFQSGAACDFGADITVTSCQFTDARHLTANIVIAATAPGGLRSVTVTNPDAQSASLPNSFMVIGPPPIVALLSPSAADQGQSLSVTLTGKNFEAGATCDFGNGITVTACQFLSPTQLTANLSIATDAPTTIRKVTVTNPDGQTGQSADFLSRFTVRKVSAPNINSVSPNVGRRGQSSLTVQITGANFQTGATCNFYLGSTGALDPGITVQSCAVDSATQMTATINISSTAALGSRNVGVTNPNGLSALRILRFEVLPAQ